VLSAKLRTHFGSADNFYAGAFEIIDSNNNVEIEFNLGGGTSGGSQPTWATAEGDTTTDGGIIWYNFGANPVAGLSASGGTSGIIMDNTVTNPGGSQIYYSTLEPTGCFTSVRNWRLCGSGITTGIKLEKAATFMANENSSDKTQVSATTKKPYEKPSFRYEQVFVTTALSCGKTGTQAQCSLNIKVS
jgi:hypothetical protein